MKANLSFQKILLVFLCAMILAGCQSAVPGNTPESTGTISGSSNDFLPESEVDIDITALFDEGMMDLYEDMNLRDELMAKYGDVLEIALSQLGLSPMWVENLRISQDGDLLLATFLCIEDFYELWINPEDGSIEGVVITEYEKIKKEEQKNSVS